MRVNRTAIRVMLLALLVWYLLLCGCNPVTRHEVLTTIFDGVPSFPPQEELCKEYAENMMAASAKGAAVKQGETEKPSQEGSRHQPYDEKRCDDCHDKEKEGGLIKPKNELCFVCHVDFIKGGFIHGPVAVGDCLACHLPHTASFKSLLKIDRSQICSSCHKEKRLAAALHDSVRSKKMDCADCHDPHSGTARYFLK